MTKLPPPCLKDNIAWKFSLKTHINYILLETSCIDLHIGDVFNNISNKFTEIFTFFYKNLIGVNIPLYADCGPQVRTAVSYTETSDITFCAFF